MAVAAMIIALIAGRLHPGNRSDRVIRDADALSYRVVQARLAGGFDYRPFRRAGETAETDLLTLRSTAAALRRRWRTLRDGTAGRKSGQAQVLSGNSEAATTLLTEVLEHEVGRTDLLSAIRASRNSALLIDLSAAMLERPGDARSLVLAFEAADRSWRLARTPQAAWNRGLAAERLGIPGPSACAWRDVTDVETSPEWKHEARQREAATQRLTRITTESPELFFHRDLVAGALTGARLTNALSGDRLASDTVSALAAMTVRDTRRLRSALQTYLKGRDAFDRADLHHAGDAFSAAERELVALRVPLVFLVREQRIRCQCAQAQRTCLDEVRALRTDLVAVGRYPWLAARAAYAEGQTLYRQGRVYDAAEAFQRSLEEFRAIGDPASAGLAHSVLGNTYSAEGEPEAALEHHLAAVHLRFIYAGDRRRIELEDAMLFFLRHAYVATAELLLDELSSAPATESARVMEAVLRGVIAFRRGHSQEAEQHFVRAHELLAQIGDTTLHAEAMRSVVLAETGCGLASKWRKFVDIDAAATVAQQKEMSLWLPRMLTERGIAFESVNDLGHAEEDYLRAISILEQREPRIDQSSLTLGTGSALESPFDRAIRLYLKQQRIAAALSVAQRSTLTRISALQGRAAGVPDVFRTASGNEKQGLEDIRHILPTGHVAVAQYLLSDAVLTWVVTPNGVRVIRRDVTADRLTDAVRDLHACASHGGCNSGPTLERVSIFLLRDWIEYVPRGATVWLQRPVELQAVPFAMLRTRDDEPLLSRNPLTTGPGFRALVRAQRLDVDRRGTVTAFFAAASHPPGELERLPMVLVEVRRAAPFYATNRVVESASRRTFVQGVLPYTIAHFAGHVLVNDEQPLLSALAFDDGLLYIHELDRHALCAIRLVVLSGCDSGRTPKPAMSVANALLSQDVPSVVYTVWPVEDSVAADFAVAFHRAIALGKSRAESVQSAASLIRQQYPNRPDAWAAFQLAGAPGPITTAR